jgi:hypothetical protein
MGWLNGNFTRTNGTYTGSNLWAQTQSAGIGILSTMQDLHDQDIAGGVNACWNRDGSNAPTADMSMGSHKLTNLTAGSTAGNAVEYAQWQASVFPSGTKTVFYQAAAPTGWTQVTTLNDVALRIVNGGTGGTAYTSGQAFSSAAAAGTISGTAITQANLPNVNFSVSDPGHTHTYTDYHATAFTGGSGGSGYFVQPGTSTDTTNPNTTGISVNSGGSGTTHGHTFSGSAINVNYANVILCQKS